MILRAAISFIVFFLLSSVVMAQPHDSDLGRFQTDVIQGCQPLTVTVDAPYCNGQPCTINFGEGDGSVQFANTKTYSEPGEYKMSILFGPTGSDTIRIVVLPNIQPNFDLYTCGNGTVVTKLTDTTPQYDDYIINYSDGGMDGPLVKGSSVPHPFGISGTQTVSVRGRKDDYEDNCSATVKTIDTSAPIAPGSITGLEATSPSQLQLAIDGSPVTLYKLEIRLNTQPSFQNFRDVYDVPAVTVDNLQNDNNYYCFRLGMFNPCSTVIEGYSDIICSADFDALAKTDANELTWRTNATGIADLTITKTDPGTSHTPLTTAPTPALLVDTDLICKTEYTYRLISNYANGARSLSLPKTVTAFSSRQPVPPQNISAVVEEDTRVTLTWDQDPSFRPEAYTINTLRNGTPAGTTQTTDPTYTDSGYDTTIPTCYTISYKDLCDNASPASQPACPVQLAGTLKDDNSIVLTWSPYTGWLNGVSTYQVMKFDANGNALETVTTNSTSYTDAAEDFQNQVYRYTIHAVPNDGAITPSVSNTITETKDPNLYHPTAFTPNGDGLNDRFIVFCQYVTGFELSIFNRWGELMFSTTELTEGWDGTYKGNPMPEGQYAFRAKITDMTGKTYDKSGAVLLLKRRD
jgi:gliding motility-associated-like protein